MTNLLIPLTIGWLFISCAQTSKVAYFGEFEQLIRRKVSAGYGLKVSARFG